MVFEPAIFDIWVHGSGEIVTMPTSVFAKVLSKKLMAYYISCTSIHQLSKCYHEQVTELISFLIADLEHYRLPIANVSNSQVSQQLYPFFFVNCPQYKLFSNSHQDYTFCFEHTNLNSMNSVQLLLRKTICVPLYLYSRLSSSFSA